MTDKPVLRAARYRRVSKGDGSQTVENQYPETLAKIAGLGLALDPARDYSDMASGWSEKAKLPERDRLLADAERGDLRGWTLVTWALDRLSRRGIRDVFDVLDRLKRAGVFVVSVKEPWFDTRGENPMAELMAAFLAWVARYESDRKSERCRAAYQRKRMEAEGGPVRWGRPGRKLDLDLLRTLRKQGLGYRRIARAVGASVGRVHQALTTGN